MEPNAPDGLRGLDSVDFNTILLKSVQPSKIQASHDTSRDMAPLAVANFESEMRLLKCLHDQPNFDSILDRTRRTITPIEKFFPDGGINAFINHQSASELISEFEHPLGSIQLVHNRNLDDLCKEHNITPWPELKLYTGVLASKVQGLKPHQVDDAAAIVARGFTDYRHTFLASDIGTGKTKTYLTAIELTHRKKFKQYQRDMEEHGKSNVKFHPTLILTPTDSISEIWKEGSVHFPNMRLQVYYEALPSEFPGKYASVIKTTELQAQLRAWSLADYDPETGLIVIISTYPTWSARNIIKLERNFCFKSGSVQQKKTFQPSEDKDPDGDTDMEPPTDLKRYDKSDLNMDDIQLLANENQQAEEADGCFEEYANKYNALDEIVFEQIIADEAHHTMDSSGAYNDMLGLLSWKKLLWVTRIPVLTSFKDLISPLSLMWKAYGIKIDEKTVFQKGTTVGIFHDDFLAEYPDWKPLKDIYEASNRKCRLWIVNPTIFKHAGEMLDWVGDTGHLIVQQIYKDMCIHRTMSTLQELPDGSTHYPGIDIPPITIVVEETQYDDLGREDFNIRVESVGRAHVRNIFSSQVKEHFAELGLGFNLGEHRKGVLTAFDWRNDRILYREKPYIHATVDQLELVMKFADDPRAMARAPHLVKAERLYDLIHQDTHGGLSFFFNQAKQDPAIRPPKDRAAYMYWLGYKSPIMTRALDLAWKYAREQKQQVLVYVDDPWIQCMTVGWFRIAGLKTVTVRPDDKSEEKAKVIAGWNDPDSLDEIFVVNVKTMEPEVDVHGRCCKGMFLNWMFSVKSMLQVIGRFSRIDQTKQVTFHLIKLKNSYYDNIERISCTDWAAQLSTEIELPDWMTDQLREICIFELIKTVLHQPFNRYAWVVNLDAQGIEMEYYSDDTIRLGHMFSVVAKLLLAEEDPNFWVENADVLVEVCRCIMQYWEDPEQIEELLADSFDELLVVFDEKFGPTVDEVRYTMETDLAVQARIEAVKKGVERRAGGKPLSEEFVFASMKHAV
ncbi:hypothetical protein FSST1_010434 [Fusarium sambucinum]